ncbi:PKD domain-containing protein [Patescibacteria group bacterium]|nr:PKD domain-containing protein [Patescibacteria group bacterium]
MFTTTTAGIQKKDIISIRWDFGDGTIQTNTLLTMNYAYTKAGPRIITQTIYLLDGTILTNIININVISEQVSEDRGVDLLP